MKNKKNKNPKPSKINFGFDDYLGKTLKDSRFRATFLEAREKLRNNQKKKPAT